MGHAAGFGSGAEVEDAAGVVGYQRVRRRLLDAVELAVEDACADFGGGDGGEAAEAAAGGCFFEGPGGCAGEAGDEALDAVVPAHEVAALAEAMHGVASCWRLRRVGRCGGGGWRRCRRLCGGAGLAEVGCRRWRGLQRGGALRGVMLDLAVDEAGVGEAGGCFQVLGEVVGAAGDGFGAGAPVGVFGVF